MERERARWIIAAGVGLVVATAGLHAYWVLFAASVSAEGWAAAGDDATLRERFGDVVRLHGKVVRAEPHGGGIAVTLNDGTGRFVVPLDGVAVKSGQWLLATYRWDEARGAFVLEHVKNDIQPEMVWGGYGAGVLGILLGLAVSPRRARGDPDEEPLPGEWGNLIKWRPPSDPQAVATAMRAPSFSRAGPAPGFEGEAVGAALAGLGQAGAPPPAVDAPSPAWLAAQRAAAEPAPAPPSAAAPEPIPAGPAIDGPHVAVALAQSAEEIRGKLDMVESLLEQRGLVTGFRYGERDAAYMLAPGATAEDVLSVLALAGVPLADA
ncbi:MAG TPA: hypothetical protein VM889_06910 [Candidatus Thermoplasmatota archaeon]|nr:hypothetical protein [Candidatus Thermoplasmatota archaeon]